VTEQWFLAVSVIALIALVAWIALSVIAHLGVPVWHLPMPPYRPYNGGGG
jgi:hypothetical protein